jgi:hypothetical protein
MAEEASLTPVLEQILDGCDSSLIARGPVRESQALAALHGATRSRVARS